MRRIVLFSVVVVLAAIVGFATGRSRGAVDIGPAGPYAVGVGMHDWTDRTRYDQFSPHGGEPRTLSAWVWYPAINGKGSPSPYAPGAWRGLHRYSVAETGFDHIRTGTRVDPPQSPGRFPLVVLLPGLGLSAPQYQAIAAGMASRGYFVTGVTPTYSAKLTVINGHPVAASRAGDPPDLNATVRASIVSVWAADARFAAARTAVQYNGHVDASKVVYVGHELGAAAAVAACHSDEHCAGAVSLAGSALPGSPALSRPQLLLNSGAAAARGPVMAYTVSNAGPLAFTDYAAYRLAWPLRRVLPLGSLDGRQALAVTTGYLDAFLTTSFRGTPWQPPASPFVRADDVARG
jgi:dienelactone hydrolase